MEGSQKGEGGMEDIGALLSQELFTYRQGRLDRRCRIEWMVIPDVPQTVRAGQSREGVPA
jgi:hypothetical protein